MINVVFYKNKNGDIYGFSIKGHAEFAKKGNNDIVCSAASILVINTVNCIELLTDEKAITKEDESKGIIELELPNFKMGNVSNDAALLIKAMAIGLKSLENDYPKNINIKEEAPND